jgi:multisubunit Na+/H+ antiporter MnhC subunit
VHWFSQAARTLVLTITTLVVFGVVLGVLADYSAVSPIFGITGVAGVLFICGSGVVTYDELKTPSTQRHRAMAIAVVLFVVGSVAVFPGAKSLLQNNRSSAEPAATPPAQPPPATTSSTVPTTTPVPTGTPVPADSGCPRPDPTDPALPSVDVQVVHWCKGEVRGPGGVVDAHNYQIKLRPRLVNNTTDKVRIEITTPAPSACS